MSLTPLNFNMLDLILQGHRKPKGIMGQLNVRAEAELKDGHFGFSLKSIGRYLKILWRKKQILTFLVTLTLTLTLSRLERWTFWF